MNLLKNLAAGLLGKIVGILPLNTIVSMAVDSSAGKAVLGPVVAGYQKMSGFKTQGLLIVAGTLFAASSLGYLPWDTSKPLINALLAAAVPTMAEKLSKAMEPAQKAQETIDAASKPL